MKITQKDIIFKIINSLMKYMDEQALLKAKLGFLLYCISSLCTDHPLPLVKIREGASVIIHCR